jgi:3'(2'), 5'-bisphosphate nucleotidase
MNVMIKKGSDPLSTIGALSIIAEDAGKIINASLTGSAPPKHRIKQDLSPVTAADEAANTFIVDSLKSMDFGLPIIAEESVSGCPANLNSNSSFWLVDPLDGTKEFIAGRSEFTVNIALIAMGKPILGVIHLPAQNITYMGHHTAGAFKRTGAGEPETIRVRKQPPDGATIVVSRSHLTSETKEWLSNQNIRAYSKAGSSLKFCLLAEGRADLYPRLGRTMEWDIAAGHAILSAAGGDVEEINGEPLRYGKPGFENPNFIAHGG